MLRKALVGALIATALTATGGQAAQSTWSSFSPGPVINFADPALGRTPDGVLHVLWVQDDGSGAEDLFQTTVAPDGTVAPASAVLTDWSSMWGGGGDIATASDGRLMYFFGGVRGTTAGDPHDNMSMLTSDAAGTTWTLGSGEIVAGADGAAYATTVGAESALDGTPFQTFGGRLHRGTNPGTGVVDVHDSIGGSCCAYDSDIITDQASGQMYFGWYSNADDKRGVWAHEINPSNGALVGSPMLFPGVTQTTTAGGEPQASSPDTRIPMTGRPGHAGVFFATTGGYPFQQKVLVWRVGQPGSSAVVRTEELRSFNDPAIASDTQGRLWVSWSSGSKLFFRRSNPDANLWGRTVAVPVPSGTTAIFDVKMSAQDTMVDVIALFDDNAGAPKLWHRQVMPGLTLTANPSSFRREARVTFQVLDAGVPVEGATVSVAGRTATTDATGRAQIRVGPYERGRRVTATAEKAGYTSGKKRLRIRG